MIEFNTFTKIALECGDLGKLSIQVRVRSRMSIPYLCLPRCTYVYLVYLCLPSVPMSTQCTFAYLGVPMSTYVYLVYLCLPGVPMSTQCTYVFLVYLCPPSVPMSTQCTYVYLIVVGVVLTNSYKQSMHKISLI